MLDHNSEQPPAGCITIIVRSCCVCVTIKVQAESCCSKNFARMHEHAIVYICSRVATPEFQKIDYFVCLSHCYNFYDAGWNGRFLCLVL
jgi:hypothetical protein